MMNLTEEQRKKIIEKAKKTTPIIIEKARKQQNLEMTKLIDLLRASESALEEYKKKVKYEKVKYEKALDYAYK